MDKGRTLTVLYHHQISYPTHLSVHEPLETVFLERAVNVLPWPSKAEEVRTSLGFYNFSMMAHVSYG